MSKEIIQAEINLLHKQLEAKQLELDAKYAERNALRPKTALQRRGPILKMKES